MPSDPRFKEIKNILNTRCNKDFKIKNKENFKKYAEYINKSIHEYEKFAKSEQSCNLGKLFPTNASILTSPFHKEKIKGSFISLTLDEIKKSCKPGWEYGTNVFLLTNIIGKDYIDTFLQDQKGLEVDVRNVENIGGAFTTFLGGKQSTYEFFNNSPFSLWCDSLNLPRYLTHPIPLGKIVKHSPGFFEDKQLSKKINNAETTKVRISWEEYDNNFY